MLDRLFGWGKKKEEPQQQDPGVRFGRYSDNNKPPARISRWTDAENLYKEKKYFESLDAFFDYTGDDQEQNLKYTRTGEVASFELFQGSRVVRGWIRDGLVHAEATIARMPQPSVPVMRRLLEMNLNLYYSRFAMDKDRICMRFDTTLEAASPSKMYYGLRELATKSDKQDDLLLQDFSALEMADSGQISSVPDAEKAVKYRFLQQWIREALDLIAGLDTEKFAGGISYILLSLVYRIDYLLAPDGKLLTELESIAGLYFRKDDRPAALKNRDMAEAFRTIAAKPEEEIGRFLFRAKYTFAIVSPQPYKAVTDSIQAANQTAVWYRDNQHLTIAEHTSEYGIAYCQYSYSLPRPVTELYHLMMMAGQPEYFSALGYGPVYYDRAANRFDQQAIAERIGAIQQAWREKYPLLQFNTANLRFDDPAAFNITFTNELTTLNLEVK